MKKLALAAVFALAFAATGHAAEIHSTIGNMPKSLSTMVVDEMHKTGISRRHIKAALQQVSTCKIDVTGPDSGMSANGSFNCAKQHISGKVAITVRQLPTATFLANGQCTPTQMVNDPQTLNGWQVGTRTCQIDGKTLALEAMWQVVASN